MPQLFPTSFRPLCAGLGLALALGAGGASMADAQEPDGTGASVLTVSLDQAVDRASQANSSVRIPRAEVSGARWTARSARASLLPSLSVGSGISWQGSGEQRLGGITTGELGITGQPAWLFSSWDVGLTLSLSGRALLAPWEADAGLDAAVARVGAAEAGLVLEVTRGYLAVLQAQEGIRLAERELDRAERNLELAEGRVAVGSATPLDSRQAELAVGRARVALLRAQGEHRNAGISLLLLMGESADRELRLTSGFPAASPVPLREEELVQHALARNPDLHALRAQNERTGMALRAARSAYLPTLQLTAGWSAFSRRAVDGSVLVDQARARSEGLLLQCLSNNDLLSRLVEPLPPTNCAQYTFRDSDRERILEENRAFPLDFTRQPPMATLSLQLPVFQGLQRQQQVEVARVERETARLRVEEGTRDLRGEVLRQVTVVRTAYEAARIEEVNREVAAAQVALARDQYEVGMVEFLQLADAEAELARAERDRLDAIYGYHEALAALEALVGIPLRSP